MKLPNQTDRLRIGGIAHARIEVPAGQARLARVTGMFRNSDGRTDPGVVVREEGELTVIEGHLHNAFVNQGLQAILDSAYGDLVANRITHIGLSADTSAVTATTTSLDPGTAGSSIKVTANTARTDQTVSADQTWTQADVAWAITKIGLLTGSAVGNVVNIIGGTGGTAPYDEPFTIDLTNIATWTLTMGVEVTATAS